MTNNIRNALKVFADLGVGSGPDHETETYQIERGAIRKAREVLDCGGDSAEKVSELAAPKIKPLVWEHEKATTHVPETWRAKSIGREYDIQRTGDGKFDLWADVGTALSVEDTIEAAQSAAQAHHDQHIRSDLQDSPCCKGLAPITECQCEQDRLSAPRASELDLRVQIDDLTALNKKLTDDFNTLALDRAQWQIRAEEKDHQLAAIGKERDYAVEAMEEARTYMRIETTHARSAETRAEKLSIALAAEQAINKDLKIELDEALAYLAAAHGKFCKIAETEAWTDTCLDGYRKTPGGLREFAESAAKEIDRSIEAGTAQD